MLNTRSPWSICLLLPAACLAGLAGGTRADDSPPADAAAVAEQEPAADEAGEPAKNQPAEPAGDPPGLDDLNAAIDAKLAVDELDDFGRVLALCRRAVDRGLDDESRRFAEDLYTGTLIDRAGMLVEAIFRSSRLDPQWQRIRLFAMRDLDEVVKRDPKMGSAHLMIARLQSLPDGDRNRAAAAAAKALGLLGDDKLQRAQATLVLAELAEEPREKEAFLDAAVELAPRDGEMRRARGFFRLAADDFDGAREDLEVAAAEEPRDAAVLGALGLACMMADRLDEARDAFDQAIELEPDAPGLLLQRARIHALESDREEALADISRALEIAPRDPAALLLRARINQQAGDTEAALADLERVLDRDPNAPAALELRGLLAAEREDYPAAIRDFRRLAARDPNDAAVLGQLAMLYLADDQPREAIRRFTRALEIDEDNFGCLRGRSDAEITIGDHDAAIEDLERAVALEPDDTGVLNNLAWLLATSPEDEIRDGKRAIELAERACDLTAWEEAHIISTLAAAHAEAGDFERAREYSRQAVETGSPEGEVAEQLRAELASYEVNKPWRERQSVEEKEGDTEPEAERAEEAAERAEEEAAVGPMAGKPVGDEPARQAVERREPRRPFIDD